MVFLETYTSIALSNFATA